MSKPRFKRIPLDSLVQNKQHGHSPSIIVFEASDTDLWSEAAFQSSPGQPLREMFAGASLAFAIFSKNADKVRIHGLLDDPPDIAVSFEGKTSLWEVTDVLLEDQRPRKVAVEREAFTKAFEAATAEQQRDLIDSQMGEAQVYSRERLVKEQKEVVVQARSALLKKARKYAKKAKGELGFGLILYSRIISGSSCPIDQGTPNYWSAWLSDAEKAEAEIFSDVCFVYTNLPQHSALVLRRNNSWLNPPELQRCNLGSKMTTWGPIGDQPANPAHHAP